MTPVLLHLGHSVSLGAWHFEPTVVAGAVVVCGMYAQLTWKAGRPDWRRIACFYAGALSMIAALVSPLDVGAERLLSLHMLQHVFLTSIGPPLVLLGLPPGLLAPILQVRLLRDILRLLVNPMVAAPLFLVNMWIWHAPPVYEEALTNLPVHVVMHLAFIATGLLFWWPVVQPLPQLSPMGEGARLLYLFVSGFPMGLLALLLLSSGKVVYSFYETAPRLWGISPIADQQVAGMIMGALGEAASFVAITVLFFRFLDREGTEATRPGSLDVPGSS